MNCLDLRKAESTRPLMGEPSFRNIWEKDG